jgi:hypothetical protein
MAIAKKRSSVNLTQRKELAAISHSASAGTNLGAAGTSALRRVIWNRLVEFKMWRRYSYLRRPDSCGRLGAWSCEKSGLGRRLRSEDPWMDAVHPNTAGIDVGNSAHYVAVRPDRDSEPVRRFECFTATYIAWRTGYKAAA